MKVPGGDPLASTTATLSDRCMVQGPGPASVGSTFSDCVASRDAWSCASVLETGVSTPEAIGWLSSQLQYSVCASSESSTSNWYALGAASPQVSAWPVATTW